MLPLIGYLHTKSSRPSLLTHKLHCIFIVRRLKNSLLAFVQRNMLANANCEIFHFFDDLCDARSWRKVNTCFHANFYFSSTTVASSHIVWEIVKY